MARFTTRWDPYRDLTSLQTDLNRLFGQAFGGSEMPTGHGSWTPFLDVCETADAFEIDIDLPGVSPGDVEATLDQNVLTIRGERKWPQEGSADQGYHRLERRYGAFMRTVSLPSHVDAEGIQASFSDGVLHVSVPKAEQAKPRKIKIGEGARQLT